MCEDISLAFGRSMRLVMLEVSSLSSSRSVVSENASMTSKESSGVSQFEASQSASGLTLEIATLTSHVGNS